MDNNKCYQPTIDNTTTPPSGVEDSPEAKYYTTPGDLRMPDAEERQEYEEATSYRNNNEHYFKPQPKETYLKSIAKMNLAAEIRMRVDELNQLIRKAGKKGLKLTITGNGHGELVSHSGQISLQVKIEQVIEY